MTYTVKFRDDALREWLKLDKSVQQQFAKKLKKCSENPHIPSAKLRGLKDCYKKTHCQIYRNTITKIGKTNNTIAKKIVTFLYHPVSLCFFTATVIFMSVARFYLCI